MGKKRKRKDFIIRICDVKLNIFYYSILSFKLKKGEREITDEDKNKQGRNRKTEKSACN